MHHKKSRQLRSIIIELHSKEKKKPGNTHARTRESATNTGPTRAGNVRAARALKRGRERGGQEKPRVASVRPPRPGDSAPMPPGLGAKGWVATRSRVFRGVLPFGGRIEVFLGRARRGALPSPVVRSGLAQSALTGSRDAMLGGHGPFRLFSSHIRIIHTSVSRKNSSKQIDRNPIRVLWRLLACGATPMLAPSAAAAARALASSVGAERSLSFQA